MGQYVGVDVVVEDVSADKAELVQSIISDIVDLEPEKTGHYPAFGGVAWYGEGTICCCQDMQELSRKLTKQIMEELGGFHVVQFKVEYLENCPFDDFSFSSEEELDSN